MAYSQEKQSISGYISDSKTGERLIGAHVYVKELKQGTATNLYGFYSLTLPKGEYDLQISYIGYKSISQKVKLEADQILNIDLQPSTDLEEVVVTAESSREEFRETLMSTNRLSMKTVEMLPVLLGEKDIIKTLQLLPGVQSGSEGSSGLYVRGGGPDQNLILLDGVPVYNSSHLFGFFSVFNSDALNSVTLTKGGFPARYGGRLSSVLDIRMKEGNMKKVTGDVSIGLISSRFNIEGPIKKDKTSFMLSARRTYIDILLMPLIKAQSDGNKAGYFFYDINAKINHKFSEKSRLYLSAYNGLDKFYSKNNDTYNIDDTKLKDNYDSNLNWGNRIAALRWNYILSPKMFMNTTATYSRYNFEMEYKSEYQNLTAENKIRDEINQSKFLSNIEDYAVKFDVDYIPNPNHYIKFGLGNIFHKFRPGANQFKSNTEKDVTVGAKNIDAKEFYSYIEDDIKINDVLKFNVGLHFAGLSVKDKNYFSLQPRISGRYLLNDRMSIKASYSRMNQFLHLLSNPTVGLPTDLWVPSTNKIKPELSDQYSLGYSTKLNDKFDFSVETYYKTIDNLIEYGDGTSFFGVDDNWENKIVVGSGEAYGIEFLLKKKVGKTTGWIGYTLSKSNRQFPNVNQGKSYPYKYDRKHDISVVFMHKFSKKFDIGANWVYGTGNAFTLGTETYSVRFPDGSERSVENVPERNNYRMHDYHRLDIGFNFHKQKKKTYRTWTISVYNAYSRKNPFFLYFKNDDRKGRKLKQVSLFPILPSITYSLKF
jgi:outer membrane cobalamin receptor